VVTEGSSAASELLLSFGATWRRRDRQTLLSTTSQARTTHFRFVTVGWSQTLGVVEARGLNSRERLCGQDGNITLVPERQPGRSCSIYYRQRRKEFQVNEHDICAETDVVKCGSSTTSLD
jgi:hypothetical protein